MLEAFFWILCAYVVLVPTYQYFNTRKKKVQAKEWPPEDFGPVQRFAENRIPKTFITETPLPRFTSREPIMQPEVRPAGSRVHTSVADKKKKPVYVAPVSVTYSNGKKSTYADAGSPIIFDSSPSFDFSPSSSPSFDFSPSSSSYDSGSSSSDYSGGGGDSSGGGASGDW